MIEFENTSVWGFEHAVRGMRNSYNSWDRSDSRHTTCGYSIGDADLALMRKLIKAGPSHRKFLRQIFVSVDITAPLYWWKEFDTYKVDTTANSCSTMHTITERPFKVSDFSIDYLYSFSGTDKIVQILNDLNTIRDAYINYEKLASKSIAIAAVPKKDIWYALIQYLPSSYNQKRTVTMTYENLLNILDTRKNHKLNEWRDFCKWIEYLPYADLFKEALRKTKED